MMKNDKKNENNEKKRGKLQVSKKWKIAIFLEFFSFFLSFFLKSFLLPVVELMQNDEKW